MSSSDSPATHTPEKKNTRRARKGIYQATASSITADDNVGYLIKLLHTSFNRMIDRKVSPLGLTAMQWRPLALIRYRNVNTPAELARLAHIDTGAMTRTLDRLQAKGLITRSHCVEDRRVVKLELTDQGMLASERIPAALADTLNEHLQGFNKDEVEQLVGFLNRMLTNGQSPDDTD
ncbi:MarR family winged helix-turn-helix transcriptional regulator [Allopusillimonas ginsengisoli]|uniref:MarR family winged helix-turn-helix transcriptional regulator n=1 Tax=Allopusillimonas ginsengisoli TaxID=453575 RepID=UPI0010C173BF|nr:MarR family transcriptional regulator [Allopusillimonas ginsengisoli]